MGRIMAIDYGTKRVGIAVTDPLKLIAGALTTVRADEAINFLKDYFRRESVESIVLGMPVKLNNTESQSFQHVVLFEKKIMDEFPSIPVIRADERFTSRLAVDAMVRGGMKKKDRQKKENIDMISAVIILQSYLESRAFNEKK